MTPPRPADVPGATGTPTPALRLDALGSKCPIPILLLAERIGEVEIGQTVQLLADDPAARADVPAWCTLKSHDFLALTELPGRAGWAFLIRRNY